MDRTANDLEMVQEDPCRALLHHLCSVFDLSVQGQSIVPNLSCEMFRHACLYNSGAISRSRHPVPQSP